MKPLPAAHSGCTVRAKDEHWSVWMSLSFLRYFLFCALAVIVLAAAVGLYLFIDGETASGDIGPESPQDAWRAQYRGTHLEFIVDTGRIVVNEDGTRQIVWDPPELPSLKESIVRGRVAKLLNIPELLPLCTQEYLQHLKAQKEPREPDDSRRRLLPRPSFPVCNAIPDSIFIGLPSGPGNPGRQNSP